jgi:hypothetical protein
MDLDESRSGVAVNTSKVRKHKKKKNGKMSKDAKFYVF